MRAFLILLSWMSSAQASMDPSLRLFPGFITKIRCEGRLLVSAVGDERTVRLEALPRELGCGVLLKPIGSTGRTNLLLETSTGTIRRLVSVIAGAQPSREELEFQLKGESP